MLSFFVVVLILKFITKFRFPSQTSIVFLCYILNLLFRMAILNLLLKVCLFPNNLVNVMNNLYLFICVYFNLQLPRSHMILLKIDGDTFVTSLAMV